MCIRDSLDPECKTYQGILYTGNKEEVQEYTKELIRLSLIHIFSSCQARICSREAHSISGW